MAKPKLKGLGRGLDALFSAADEEIQEDRLQVLAVSAIRPGRYQPRSHMDEVALNELADSIRAQGVIQPVVVREVDLGRYELIAGERRWRASQLAGLAELPAVVRQVPDETALAMALIENIQRQELDPLEEAHGLKRLIDEFGLTHDATAQAVGRSRSAVSNLLRLLALPEPVQHMLHKRELEMGHARALLPLPVLHQVELAKEISDKGLSVREVEERVKRTLEPAAPREAKPVDPDVARLAEELSEHIGARVQIRHGRRGTGRLSIDYGSLDELDSLLEKLQAKSI
ncbi:ParB/RepB/Spo0J family partition protein [Crenobacter cavernae]|uniref:ParB/RepB/Spo0J family partition protein n=1 Tax=Crenobacter cavernae TaxID=2290923 RepID=A0A345Y5L1_9NEIS|nr:ParB/RepB/Spo0J family partition protein [Crenobacter cavernae]AXK39213.1 ParB/RepB/Spo0J family partition protein [Crenobacter cavernae]